MVRLQANSYKKNSLKNVLWFEAQQMFTIIVYKVSYTVQCVHIITLTSKLQTQFTHTNRERVWMFWCAREFEESLEISDRFPELLGAGRTDRLIGRGNKRLQQTPTPRVLLTSLITFRMQRLQLVRTWRARALVACDLRWVGDRWCSAWVGWRRVSRNLHEVPVSATRTLECLWENLRVTVLVYCIQY